MAKSNTDHLPPPNAVPGVPFEDPNLKLVVIDALMTTGHIDLGSSVEFLSAMLGRPYDPTNDPQWLYKCQPAVDYLVRYPLTPEHLTAVEALCFDGGNEIYEYVWPGWDGESEDFNVRELGGLELLPNLHTFDEIAMLYVDDFRPLTGLPKLQTLGLGSGTKVPAEILLSLPALKKFTCFENEAPDQALLDTLKARGVQVRIY